MKWNIILGVFIILLFIIIIQKEPASIELKVKNCLGGNVCWIGQTLSLGVNFKTVKEELKGQNMTIQMKSLNGTIIKSNASIGNETEIKIPISATFGEGKYELKVNSDLVLTKNIFLKIKRGLKSLFFDNIYKDTETIVLKYPDVSIDINYKDPKCSKTTTEVSFDEIKLKLGQLHPDPIECKIRINVDTTFVNTNHKLLTKYEGINYKDYYETKFSQINEYDLTGSIQEVYFKVEKPIQQATFTIIPICLIENNEVEIMKGIIEKSCNDFNK